LNIQFKVLHDAKHLFNNHAVWCGDKDNFCGLLQVLIGRDLLPQKGYLHLNSLCISVALAASPAHNQLMDLLSSVALDSYASQMQINLF
jgi:hypothetical protein